MKEVVIENKINPDFENLMLNTLQIEHIEYSDTIETIDVWDSMMHMEIMVALENKYSLRIDPEEIVALTSVRAIQEFLGVKGVL